MSAYTLPPHSEQALEKVLDEYRQLPTDISYENLGRMLVAMYRQRTHPARMVHLILQASSLEAQGSDIEILTILAWASAEDGFQKSLGSKEAC